VFEYDQTTGQWTTLTAHESYNGSADYEHRFSGFLATNTADETDRFVTEYVADGEPIASDRAYNAGVLSRYAGPFGSDAESTLLDDGFDGFEDGRTRNGFLFATVWALVAYPFRVARETFSNLTDVLAQATPEDLIPPWIWGQLTSTWAWVKIQFPRALGYRATTPYEQMTASVVLAVMLVIVSIGFLTWVAPIFIFPFLFGAARLIPPVDRAWPLTASRGDRPV